MANDTDPPMKTVIVIGGGASGLMAAGQAAQKGAKVLLLEKMNRPGSKILISGKGRCNLTNTAPIQEFLNHFNRSGRFLRQAFSQFFSPQLMDFFEANGLPLVCERGGRVFPQSGRAEDVLATLLSWLSSCGVIPNCKQQVSQLLIDGKAIAGVICNGSTIAGDSVIIATGGASYPATGSTGDGYTFARQAGHSIVEPRPALVPLLTADSRLHHLAGLDLRNIGVRVWADGKRRINDFGEVGFTRSGIGGPVILTHSRNIIEWLESGSQVTVALDLKPALDERKLDGRLRRDFQQRHGVTLQSVLRGLLPPQLVPVCLELSNLDGSQLAGTISAEDRARLRIWLKDFRFALSGHRPLREGIVTAGGVMVKEVNPQTMESLLVDGLYFCGEVLDVDGDTGGYNLQAAFSTGWVAGRAAASQ